MKDPEVGGTLNMVADVVGRVTMALPGPLMVAGALTEMVLRAGVAIANAGKDPVIEIHHILSASDEVAKVHQDWQGLLEARFGRDTDPPPTDPYEDID